MKIPLHPVRQEILKKNFVTGNFVGSEHLNDILEARVIGKEHLDPGSFHQ